MTENIPTVTTLDPEVPAKPKRKKRIFMWVFLAVQALFLIWIISAVSADPTADCKGGCEDAATGIAVFFQIMVWCVTDFLLGVGYLIYRVAKRP